MSTTNYNALSSALSTLSHLLVSVALAQSVYTVTPTATIPAPVALLATTSTPQAWVAAESLKYGVNPSFSSCIVSHESQWQNRSGDDGNSRGYWQISKIWHPEVSDAVAYSFQSSTDWSLDWIAQGHAKQWSTFWLYCSSTPIFTN
jgi:hypothetical protein